jgi:putative membrane protein
VHHGTGPGPLVATPLVAAALGYLVAVHRVRRRDGRWPARRTASWCAGLIVAAAAVYFPARGMTPPLPTGPAASADMAGQMRALGPDFVGHMTGHLLLGMAAPLLLVLAAPVTLALRALPVARARNLSRLLKARPVRILTHPVTAGVLDAGGLWVLYTTGLYRQTTEYTGLHVLVHAHVLAAGYLFTAAIAGVDPAAHRPGFRTRAVVLVAFVAAHDILAKFIYAHPPAGVPETQAQTAAQLMYYGGDLLDLALITVLCGQWYAARNPARPSRSPGRRAWRLPADI